MDACCSVCFASSPPTANRGRLLFLGPQALAPFIYDRRLSVKASLLPDAPILEANRQLLVKEGGGWKYPPSRTAVA